MFLKFKTPNKIKIEDRQTRPSDECIIDVDPNETPSSGAPPVTCDMDPTSKYPGAHLRKSIFGTMKTGWVLTGSTSAQAIDISVHVKYNVDAILEVIRYVCMSSHVSEADEQRLVDACTESDIVHSRASPAIIRRFCLRFTDLILCLFKVDIDNVKCKKVASDILTKAIIDRLKLTDSTRTRVQKLCDVQKWQQWAKSYTYILASLTRRYRPN
jgi:hypothetical protein